MGDTLLSSVTVGDLTARTRAWMAPLTRSRSRQPGDIPWALNAEYYRQRANPETGAALIVSEATQVSQQGKGYAFTPGIHTEAQAEGWRLVTDAVHAEGGLIVAQLWHVGRISHTALQPDGAAPVAPSAVRAKSRTYIDAESGMVDVSEPRALETDEIPGIVGQFRRAAELAKAAGFDGVEIHGANGYLLDQFTRDGTNHRTDAYGGSLDNRLRFPLEVASAVAGVFGPGRVGYRLSPTGEFNDLRDGDPAATFGTLARRLGELGLAYIHNVESFGPDAARDERVIASVREGFKGGHPTPDRGVYVSNGNLTPPEAEARLRDGLADAVAFGKLFISNPDLVGRIRRGAELAAWDQATFYGGTEKGYTDYPALAGAGA